MNKSKYIYIYIKNKTTLISLLVFHVGYKDDEIGFYFENLLYVEMSAIKVKCY